MTRSAVALLAGLALGLVAGAGATEAQPSAKIPRIGVLAPVPVQLLPVAGRLEAFRQGLRDLGYVEGQTVAIEVRTTDGQDARLPDVLDELLRLKVDVIVTWTTPAAVAARQATRTVPIVAMTAPD